MESSDDVQLPPAPTPSSASSESSSVETASASAPATPAESGAASSSSSSHGPSGGANDYSRFDDIEESSDDGGENGDEKSDGEKVPVIERLFQAGSAKMEGNAHITKGEAGPAATQYRKGIKVLEDMRKASSDAVVDGGKKSGDGDNPIVLSPAQEVEAHELELSLHLNLSMAEIKLKNYSAAIKAATSALKLDAKNVKALFRRGQAHRFSGNFSEAKADLTELLAQDSSNGSAKKELAVVVRKIKESKAKEKKGFANLFERAGGMYDDVEAERKRKAEEKAASEAKLRAEWEKAMAEEEAEWQVKKAERDAEAARKKAEESAKEADEGKAAALEDHEKDIMDFVEKKDEDSDSDDEPDPLKKFVRTPFEEWKKNREEAEKKAKEATEREEEEKRRAAREARRAAERREGREERDEAEVDEEDAKMLAEISKKGYCHHARNLDANEVITEISPQKVGAMGDHDNTSSSKSTARSGWAPSKASSASSSPSSSFTPQRIDNASGGAAGGGSAWNKNGTTWEERDCSEWAKECAKRNLKKAVNSSGAGDLRNSPENVVGMLDQLDMRSVAGQGEAAQMDKIGELASMLAKVTARVTKVSKVEGDASVAVVRGKKRYLFDLSADLEYEVLVDESFGMDVSETDTTPARQATYKGKFSIKEITHDAVNDGEVEVGAAKPSKGSAPKGQHKVRVEKAVEGLKNDILKRCLSLFVTEFQSSQ